LTTTRFYCPGLAKKIAIKKNKVSQNLIQFQNKSFVGELRRVKQGTETIQKTVL